MGLGPVAFAWSTLDPNNVPAGQFPRWAVLGRSNVGKSSFLNALVHPGSVFRTGKQAGVTRGIVAARVKLGKSDLAQLEIVDLPGFGFAKGATDEERERWQEISQNLAERSDPGLMWIWLGDPTRVPEELERGLLNWLKGRPFLFVFTKADKIKPAAQAAAEKAWAPVIGASTEGPYWVSSMKGEGLQKVHGAARSFVRLSMERTKK